MWTLRAEHDCFRVIVEIEARFNLRCLGELNQLGRTTRHRR